MQQKAGRGGKGGGGGARRRPRDERGDDTPFRGPPKRRKVEEIPVDVTVSKPDVQSVSSNWQRLKNVIAAPPAPSPAATPAAPVPWWVKKDAAKRAEREEAARAAAEAARKQESAAQRAANLTAQRRVEDVLGTTIASGEGDTEAEVTDVVAMDCEMVGVGVDGLESVLAHVCIVNEHGAIIYNQRVQTVERVVDYRTQYSGIRPRDLKAHTGALPFATVQSQVATLIENRILVGHALSNDLKALMLTHPRHLIRDTARYRPLQRAPKKPHALRYLVKSILGITIQSGEHDPAEDARAALLLYKHLRTDWERWIKTHSKNKKSVRQTPKKS